MKLNNHSLPACLLFTTLQTSACPWSLIVPSTLCHGIKTDYDQTKVLANLGCTPSRSVWFLAFSLCNAVLCANSVQRPSEGVYLSPVPAEGDDGNGPQHMDFSPCNSFVGWIQPQMQCTEVISMLVKVPLGHHEAPELLFAQCEIQQGPCL